MQRVLFSLIAIFFLLPTSASLHPMLQESAHMTSLQWSPDSTRVAASFSDNMVKVWSVSADSSELITPPLLTFRPEFVNSISWTTDSRFLVSEGRSDGYVENGIIDADVSKWDAKTGKLIEHLVDFHMATTYEFNYFAYYVLPVIAFDRTLTRAAFSYRDTRIAISGYDNAVLFTDYGYVKEILWSPNSTLIAALYGESDTYQIRTFDVTTGNTLNMVNGTDYWVSDMRWSSDNAYLAVTSVWANPFDPYANVRLYRVAEGVNYFGKGDVNLMFDDIESSDDGSNLIPAIAWHPRANILAIASRKDINFYGVASEESIATISAQDTAFLDWSPDGKHLIGSSATGEIQIWDAPDLES